ncbi:hypothetical protein CYMTET_46190 [Cymbomonas tetramitiformis]|uniref:Uncharacterized protein n=1 Tax=Cymbomonas tetramitiformis TaxID=36881 RepID=A0AAE0BY60_9CHLO|nr:hypothetical protein CYMTET_46190 [Cymbomonas tetramitiformis]
MALIKLLSQTPTPTSGLNTACNPLRIDVCIEKVESSQYFAPMAEQADEEGSDGQDPEKQQAPISAEESIAEESRVQLALAPQEKALELLTACCRIHGSTLQGLDAGELEILSKEICVTQVKPEEEVAANDEYSVFLVVVLQGDVERALRAPAPPTDLLAVLLQGTVGSSLHPFEPPLNAITALRSQYPSPELQQRGLGIQPRDAGRCYSRPQYCDRQ